MMFFGQKKSFLKNAGALLLIAGVEEFRGNGHNHPKHGTGTRTNHTECYHDVHKTWLSPHHSQSEQQKY